MRRGVCAVLVVAAAGAWGATTLARNTVYRDELTFWSDVAGKSPRNVRARVGLAAALNAAELYEEAAEQAMIAAKANPNHAMAHNHLGFALAKLGRTDLALAAYREAIRLDPNVADVHLNLGNVLRFSDPQAAVAEYRLAIALRAHFVERTPTWRTSYRKRRRPRRRNTIARRSISTRPTPRRTITSPACCCGKGVWPKRWNTTAPRCV